MAFLAENKPLDIEYPSHSVNCDDISYIISSGVLKSNGAGLPIFNFNTLVPIASILLASSTTGPLTSYKTLSNFDDLLKVLILTSPDSFFLILLLILSVPFLFFIGFVVLSVPYSQSISTSSAFAINSPIFFLGTASPLTY